MLKELQQKQIENERKYSKIVFNKEILQDFPQEELDNFYNKMKPFFIEYASYLKDAKKVSDKLFKKLCSLAYIDFSILSSSIYKLFLEEEFITDFDYKGLSKRQLQIKVRKINEYNDSLISNALAVSEQFIYYLIVTDYLTVEYYLSKDKIPLGIKDIYFAFSAESMIEEDEEAGIGFALPLICPPKYLKNNFNLGYYTPGLGSGYNILNTQTKTSDDHRIDYLNLVNKIAYKIDQDVLENTQNEWDCFKNEDEIRDDKKKRLQLQSFEKFNKQVKIKASLFFETPIYFCNKYDARGRIYIYAYWFNPAGNSYQKASVAFFNEEVATDKVEL